MGISRICLLANNNLASKPTFSDRYSTHSETADAEMDLDIVDTEVTDTDSLDSSASD